MSDKMHYDNSSDILRVSLNRNEAGGSSRTGGMLLGNPTLGYAFLPAQHTDRGLHELSDSARVPSH